MCGVFRCTTDRGVEQRGRILMVDSRDTAYSDGVTDEARPPPAVGTPAGSGPTEAAALLGQILGGRYRVTSLIGSGGMGAVYRAEHMELQKTVALKVLNAEMAGHREAALRFEREAMVSARISHPHVVNATDSGRLPDGSLYLVLEYVAGRSLRDLLNAEGRLPPGRALAIGAQIADALGAAHKAEIVHRDLKPGNVMLLSQEGNPEFVKVLDFGLARVVGEPGPDGPLTRTGAIFGTPEYMSPEQARGETVDHRADLYALGVILYELLCGRPPFQSPELVAVLIKHIQEAPPPLPPDVPPQMAAYVLSLLDKLPDRRPADARQVAKALRRLAPPGVVFSTAPPRASMTTLDRGGVRHEAGTLPGLRGVLGRVEWGALARQSGSWLSAVLGALRSIGPGRWGAALVTWAPAGLRLPTFGLPGQRGRALGMLSVSLVGLVGALGLWSLWSPSDVPKELRERARQGESKAMVELAAVPAEDRTGPTALALATGYFSAGEMARGLDALTQALEADSDLGEHPDALRGVRRAVDDPSTRERALELAATHMGPPGADVLFDVWRSTVEKTPATRGARKWLDSEAVRATAPPALVVALEIREVKGCDAALELLPRMTKVGDDRSLLPLRRLQSSTGCGFLGLQDCYPCLRKDAALEEAIAAVAERPAPRFDAK